MSDNDGFYAQGRLPGHTYFSKRIDSIFDRPVNPRRFVYRIINGQGGIVALKTRSEVVLHTAEGDRFQLKATLYEDHHRIGNLTLQKWNSKSGPHKEIAFSLHGREIDELLNFIKSAETMIFVDEHGGRISDSSLVQSTLDRKKIARILVEDPTLLEAVLQSDVDVQDIYGIARRKRELEYFRRMLEDTDFSTAEEASHGGPELVWQSFFEKNTWIFGYGLSYVAMSGLEGRKLRAKVAGYTIGGRGKEVDAVLKTKAAINSLCFVEIKSARTELVREYRSGVYAPSAELAGAVSQLQVNVQRALEDLTEEFRPALSDSGEPSGETLFQFQPRSFVVIGNLNEFVSKTGVHKDKFRSFELLRRSLRWPEVLTFDELYARARFIVDAGDQVSTS